MPNVHGAQTLMIRRAPGGDEQQRRAQAFFQWCCRGDVQMAEAIADAIGTEDAGSGSINKNGLVERDFTARAQGRGDNVLGEGGRGQNAAYDKMQYSQGIENVLV